MGTSKINEKINEKRGGGFDSPRRGSDRAR